ncbi:btb/poz domain-containing protein [Anaeramoeba flamelloides]|uniref:Btb/poz domain-containing protein n=1 Tax=Anaeramoeba flamelloides TaxID=1746091 RepID=A0AAV8AGV1_9EUKA|nr:btb/poz domain-containing protein [Anaeramoeba flamelloides]
MSTNKKKKQQKTIQTTNITKINKINKHPLFSEGFSSYLENGEFSDITIVVDKIKYKLHKIILSYESSFFRSLFHEEKNKEKKKIGLDLPHSEHSFPVIVRYIYCGEIEINTEDALPILGLATKFELKHLIETVSSFLLRLVKKDNVQEWLAQAIKFRARKVIDKCISNLTLEIDQVSGPLYPYGKSITVNEKIIGQLYQKNMKNFEIIFAHH